ncbi:tRNA1(Val) A37 N6-methylase TrmN6 [Persephonella hydrogeniphila]|uniref:tRNA1(Val) A37 N6-methylase TrmN6 n=1 Tax=Persephonella hydrogeniphila TaxID=198703 RepID=A0A285N0P5_9AQUI|nr:methyltransferase [Persephonella hydrogeniphila]SNZ03019.1 tRNA1(Val) A37 N6-methylase TrmN6 [Persephonella hydrogeniphila]
MEIKPKENETLTPFIRGKLQVIQSKEGYRFNVDSVFLASFVNIPDRKSNLIDLGTGSGIILLLLSLKYKNINLFGVELQETLFSQAWRNIQLNKVKAQLFKGDIREIRRIFKPETFDHVVFNPPYHTPEKEVEPTEKNIARYEIEGKLRDFIKAAGYLLKQKGKLFLIFPSTKLSSVISLLIEREIQPKRYRFVHPTREEKATHILVEGVKGGKAGGEIIEKPLIVYEDPYKKIYTPEVEFLLEKFSEVES